MRMSTLYRIAIDDRKSLDKRWRALHKLKSMREKSDELVQLNRTKRAGRGISA